MGSEEFIRLQFEEYLLSLLSSVKYHIYLEDSQNTPVLSIEGDPSQDFNPDWIDSWRQTSSYALFASHTDSHLFDIVEPRHPTAGNLSFEDIQRRLAFQIQTLHLDDRLASSKDLLHKHLTNGQKKVSTAFTNLWADIEALREAQRRKSEAAISISPPKLTDSSSNGLSKPSQPLSTSAPNSSLQPARYVPRAPDLSSAQASVAAAGHRAGAYISSWGTWASERRKGWGKTPSSGAERSADDGTGPSPTKLKENGFDFGGKGPTKNRGKEEKGGDGIGRLEA